MILLKKLLIRRILEENCSGSVQGAMQAGALLAVPWLSAFSVRPPVSPSRLFRSKRMPHAEGPWQDLHLPGASILLDQPAPHPAKIRRIRMDVEQAVFIQPVCILRVDARPGFTLAI